MGDDHGAATDTADDRDPAGSRAKLFAALAAGIIGGATLGAVLFGYRAVAPPTVVVPGFGVSTEQLPAAPTMPNSLQAPQKPAAAQGPASKADQPGAAPNPIAAESKTNEEVAGTPNAPLDPGTPPLVAPPVVIDVYVPPLGDTPEPPAPEPPQPQPPVFDPPNIEAVRFPTSRTRNPQHRRDRGPDARPRATETDGDRPEADRPQRQQMDDEAAPEQAGFAESEYEQPRDARQTLTDDCCR